MNNTYRPGPVDRFQYLTFERGTIAICCAHHEKFEEVCQHGSGDIAKRRSYFILLSVSTNVLQRLRTFQRLFSPGMFFLNRHNQKNQTKNTCIAVCIWLKIYVDRRQ